MEWKWKDQGFGNRKGEIWLELVVIIIIINTWTELVVIIHHRQLSDKFSDQVRESKAVANCKKQFKKLAPHEMESRQMVVEDHPVIATAVRITCYVRKGC